MASKILLPLLLLAAASPAALAGFNVLEMLADKPAYKQFTRLLAQSKVAEEANRLRVATVLVVTDKMIQSLAALPADKQRVALSSHVLLNYFDPIKLDEMKVRTAVLPTLLNATNKAFGVLNYTKADDGQMYFGMPGAPCVAKLVKVVAARPYSISIMEISEPILPPGSGFGKAGGRRAKGGKVLKVNKEAAAPAGAAR